MIPVVNYERMERLKPPPITNIPMNLNTFSIGCIIIGVLVLYRRYVTVKNAHERSRS
jgi:hypothetical protein